LLVPTIQKDTYTHTLYASRSLDYTTTRCTTGFFVASCTLLCPQLNSRVTSLLLSGSGDGKFDPWRYLRMRIRNIRIDSASSIDNTASRVPWFSRNLAWSVRCCICNLYSCHAYGYLCLKYKPSVCSGTGAYYKRSTDTV
jgi:hypothetical protein